MLERYAGLFGAALLAAALGCNRPTTSATPSSGNVVSRDEIAAARATTAYDAIRLVYAASRVERPVTRTERGPATLDGPDDRLPVAYINDAPYGTFSSLRKIPAAQVDSVRFYDAETTGLKFGAYPENWRGVIDVYVTR